MKVALCGYSWAGCRALDILLAEEHDVSVYTHDSPPHDVSLLEYAASRQVPTTTTSINDHTGFGNHDLLCSIYYRDIIKDEILRGLNYRAMNLHPALLPKYRGCSSLTWAMINGEEEVGYTYHLVEKTCDTGNILLQRSLPIFSYETQFHLYNRVMFNALGSFKEAFNILAAGGLGCAQSGTASYYKRGAPHGGKIDPQWNEGKIKRFIKAMTYPPLPYATLHGKEVKSYADYLRISNE